MYSSLVPVVNHVRLARAVSSIADNIEREFATADMAVWFECAGRMHEGPANDWSAWYSARHMGNCAARLAEVGIDISTFIIG